jgi:type I restriction enzyme S subunit
MIEDLKPYPEYKDSGLPWLGQVPAHWEIRPASGAFSPIRERNTGMKEKIILSLSYGRIVVKPAGKLHGLVPESFDTYQIVNPGVTVIRTTDLQNDKTSLRTGIVRDRGIITSAYLALSTSDGLLPEFGYQILNAWDITKAIYGYGSGLRQNLDFSDFRRMPVAVPPIAEQAFIARFLAWATNRLDRAIGAKRRIIALLQEQRQAIIHRAVTRGLNPSVPLKDSGIPWLEEIPEHWEVWRISRFAAVGNGSTPSRAEPRFWTGGHYPWLNSSQINRGHIDSSDQFVTPVALRECHLPKVTAGSILVAITGQGKTRGMSAVLETEATISQHLAFISPCRAIASPEFLRLALTAAYPQLRAISDDSGSTKGALTCEDLKRFYLPIPPAEEQTMLINRTQALTGDLLHSISRLECEITLLREYRTRLIADVVTGKLDVREVAAGLPEPQNVKGAQLEPEEEEPEFEAEGIETESMD